MKPLDDISVDDIVIAEWRTKDIITGGVPEGMDEAQYEMIKAIENSRNKKKRVIGRVIGYDLPTLCFKDRVIER